ncbi:site-specific DNA-methyltransferase [Marinitoga sp. 1155]|uniref:site-specific DNA-methyltransferase n=1 Tax=Marinitoga sp. 1155 TaxID=1428448 RepID=UPI000640F5CE|nr:site-specific DNA-methyltransferase [Marinitoga sp. 1155]KLO24963.1 DNA methyltransferase [Marinitoga sp. 1155]
MKKLDMKTKDLQQENIKKLQEIFPDVITEIMDENGNIRKGIDFDKLKQVLSDFLVEGSRERYGLNWVGKKEAILNASLPITKTLRPKKEESVNFENTKNIYIEGDNLEALKIIQESYLGKIKMIYIDPPYNTGKDFIYKDNFKKSRKEYEEEIGAVDEEGNKLFKNTESNGRYHSDWLSMMYPRLKIARNLLRDDGVIFISIDDNEVHNLRHVCDEIFGEENFVGEIVWLKKNAQNDADNIEKNHEYILVYKKTNDVLIYKTEYEIKEVFKDENELFYYIGAGITTGGAGGLLNARPNLGYSIYFNEKNGDFFAIDDYDKKLAKVSNDEKKVYKTRQDLIEKGYIVIRPPKKGVGLGCWTWALDKFNFEKNKILIKKTKNGYSILKKEFVNEKLIYSKDDKFYIKIMKKKPFKSFIDNIASSSGIKELNQLFNKKIFENPKNTAILKKYIKSIVSTNDLILDFFSGSATTAHAVMELNAEDGGNRQFIMVQLPEPIDPEKNKTAYDFVKDELGIETPTIAEIGKERIRRAGKKIKKDYLEKYEKELEKQKKEIEKLKNKLFSDETQTKVEEIEIKIKELEEKIEHIKNLDIGFRVYKVDTSNMKEIYYNPSELTQQQLTLFETNIKEDRNDEDLLTQVILDLGLELNLKIEEKEIKEKKIFFVEDNLLAAYFGESINEEIINEIIKRNPLRIVFRETAFKKDANRFNIEEQLKKALPNINDNDIVVL